ncbi:SLOG family protein [Pseudomonas brenneri]|uniref:SLOG family protein n=1 Tax=Pseudomonas brenneri TaxID=129817 RepID=UPI0025A13765|nr:SLOG family protein [Pseudomonas brenneri]WJM88678.1 SLOG family protein [Pseudomonas brenneri]
MTTDTEKLFADAKTVRLPGVVHNVSITCEVVDKPVLKVVKLVIAGGRDFNDIDLLNKTLHELYISKGIVVEDVCGLARGADNLGMQWAVANGCKVHEFPADWDKFGKSAGYKRNKQMGEFGDEVLVFWDGVSKGTKHMIDLAKLLNKPLTVVKY